MQRYVRIMLMLFLLFRTGNTEIIAYDVKISEWKGVYIRDTKENVVIDRYMPRGPGEFYSVFDTLDITGDGVSEIIIEHYSGGAHCCTDYMVFDVADGYLNNVWNFDAGNGGVLRIEDIDGDKMKEIITACDCLSYFGDIPYYAAKSLPRIFKYRDGKFTECTMKYPWIFDEYELNFCKSIKNAENEDEERGSYVGLVSIYMLKEELLHGYKRAESCGVSDKTIEWFYGLRNELYKILKEYYNF